MCMLEITRSNHSVKKVCDQENLIYLLMFKFIEVSILG